MFEDWRDDFPIAGTELCYRLSEVVGFVNFLDLSVTQLHGGVVVDFAVAHVRLGTSGHELIARARLSSDNLDIDWGWGRHFIRAEGRTEIAWRRRVP